MWKQCTRQFCVSCFLDQRMLGLRRVNKNEFSNIPWNSYLCSRECSSYNHSVNSWLILFIIHLPSLFCFVSFYARLIQCRWFCRSFFIICFYRSATNVLKPLNLWWPFTCRDTRLWSNLRNLCLIIQKFRIYSSGFVASTLKT